MARIRQQIAQEEQDLNTTSKVQRNPTVCYYKMYLFMVCKWDKIIGLINDLKMFTVPFFKSLRFNKSYVCFKNSDEICLAGSGNLLLRENRYVV